ncbi:MAG: hypothetical protein GY795_20965 [Desulfobacterales bacterium]|nr:hypothetical protein [Desulfobacterales bacterium]
MDIKFVTTEKYANTLREVGIIRNPLYEIQPNAWEEHGEGSVSTMEELVRNDYPIVMKKIDEFLAKRGDKISHVARLIHNDINSLGNDMLRITGRKDEYFLKIVGGISILRGESFKQTERKREILVWKTLGFEYESDKRNRFGFFPALPRFVYIMDQFNAILTPCYPGVLKAVEGAVHEFPMILNLILYLSTSFEKMHGQGLVYMDLHPENIVFQITNTGTIVFFLSDMGGALPLYDKQSDEWRALNNAIGETLYDNIFTKAEVRPSGSVYPINKPSDLTPMYDFYTLVRTAFILGGFEFVQDTDVFEDVVSEQSKKYADDLTLENPFAPLQEEVKLFYELTAPSIFQKLPVDLQQFHELFKTFFIKRARFIGEYLKNDPLADDWRHFLLKRLKLYYTALNNEKDKKNDQFQKMLIHESNKNYGDDTLEKDIKQLNLVPDYILQENFEEADKALDSVSNSRILKVSKTALYSYSFHRKVLRMSLSGKLKAPVKESFETDWPEKNTLKELASGHLKLKTLTRRVRVQMAEETQ